MRRRSFLAAFAGAAALAAALTLSPSASRAGATIDYTPGAIDTALASGKAVLVDYAADWCSVCKTQERILGSLRSDNPAYNDNIVFIRVDWDDYRRDPVTTSRNVPRRSTLVLLKGQQELGRLVASTRKDTIKGLLDKAL